MKHKTLLAQGGTVHYWVSHNENANECIVFTHGLTADHTMFEKQVSSLADKYTIILWDVPMHGLSRPYQNFSYRDTAEIIHTILQAEHIEKTFLVGMSMGGYPSQHFADRYPEMVKGFVALDTTPLGFQYYPKFDLWIIKHIEPMLKCFTTNLLKKSIAQSISETEYSRQRMEAILSPLSRNDIIQQMRIAYEYFVIENKNVTFSFPVLILVGDKDNTGKVMTYCKEWAKQTGNPLHFIKNARHFSNGDNPEQVNREIDEFIQKTVHTERTEK